MRSQTDLDMVGFLQASSSAIEEAIRSICQRNHLDPREADMFGSHARLKLSEDDCRLLRVFEGRSSFPTYLIVVLQRLFFRYRPTVRGGSPGP